MKKTRKFFVRLFLVAALILAVIQLVPYGRSHTNPPVISEPDWNAAGTRVLFFRSCRDCHSNETRWPWYSNVAPTSWLVQHDVDEARSKFNVSEWRPNADEGRRAAEMVERGEMPLSFYLPLHPEARLSAEEKRELIDGLRRTFGGGEGAQGERIYMGSFVTTWEVDLDQYRVEFDGIRWESPIPGMRQKVFEGEPRRIRLVEYTREMAPHWCSKGHFGYVLDGRFEIEFEDAVRVYEPGDGVFIPNGEEHRHKGRVLSDVVRVVFVEDV